MAVNLNELEKHLVFEVFGIPDTLDILYIDGAFGTGKTSASGAILSSRSEIRDRMDALTDATTGRLKTLLAEWTEVSTANVRIHPNAANEGVDLNPAKKRSLIKARIKVIVPIIVAENINQGAGIPIG